MGDIVRWTDAPRGMLINPKGEWCSYADVESALAASEQRNRELQARIKHMEELCAIYDAGLFALAPITCVAAYATPAQPAAGEERTT